MRTPTHWKPLASLALAALFTVLGSPPAAAMKQSPATCGFTRALRIVESVATVKKEIVCHANFQHLGEATEGRFTAR